MARPQIENGYTKIANEILEHLMRMSLSPNQWQVLLCIIRKTYGFQKKVDYITNSQIVKDTGLCKSVVSRCLQKLNHGNLISRKGKYIGLQKDWEKWKLAEQSTKVEVEGPSDSESKVSRPANKRNTEFYKHVVWRAKVFHRDNLMCRICGRSADTLIRDDIFLHSHHILPQLKHPNQRFNVDNGLTMCDECHYCYHYADENNAYGFIKQVFEFKKLAEVVTIEKLAILHQKLAEQSTKVSSPHVTQKKKETIQKKEYSSELFDFFWKAYPKKRSKGQAEKAFKKVAPDEQLLTVMLAAIERAKKSAQWLEAGGKFIPYPATWLEAKGWEDEYEEFQQQKPPGKLPTSEELEKSWGIEESAKGRIW